MKSRYSLNELVSVRYKDNAWYPARIVRVLPRPADHDVEDGDTYEVRWDPPDPNIPVGWEADDSEIRKAR